MIHYTCDMCGRPLSTDEVRYVVDMQLYAVTSPQPGEIVVDPDTDHLGDLDDLMHQADDVPDLTDDRTHALRLDLCACCRVQFLKDPLGRDKLTKELNFSKN